MWVTPLQNYSSAKYAASIKIKSVVWEPLRCWQTSSRGRRSHRKSWTTQRPLLATVPWSTCSTYPRRTSSSASTLMPRPKAQPERRGSDGKWSRSVALLQGIQAIPWGMSLWWAKRHWCWRSENFPLQPGSVISSSSWWKTSSTAPHSALTQPGWLRKAKLGMGRLSPLKS